MPIRSNSEPFNCHIISIFGTNLFMVGASCARDPSAKMSEKPKTEWLLVKLFTEPSPYLILALVPVVFPEIERTLAIRMFGDQLLIEFHTESRSIR